MNPHYHPFFTTILSLTIISLSVSAYSNDQGAPPYGLTANMTPTSANPHHHHLTPPPIHTTKLEQRKTKIKQERGYPRPKAPQKPVCISGGMSPLAIGDEG